MPLLDPDPVERARVAERGAARRTTSSAVERAVERIRARRAREGRARARGARARGRGRTTRPPSSAPCARCSRPATAGASARRSSPSSAPARSCSCAATAQRAQTVALAGTHAAQRRPGRRRPPRRAAAAERQGPRGAGDRRAPDRAHARPGQPLGGGGRGAGARARSTTSSTSPRRSAPSSPSRCRRVELAGLLLPDPGRRRRAARARAAADPGARGPRPRLVRRRRSAGPTSPRTASSAWRCAARCCAGRSPTCTRAAGSCATRCPPRSSPRPRSSSQALLPLLVLSVRVCPAGSSAGTRIPGRAMFERFRTRATEERGDVPPPTEPRATRGEAHARDRGDTRPRGRPARTRSTARSRVRARQREEFGGINWGRPSSAGSSPSAWRRSC